MRAINRRQFLREGGVTTATALTTPFYILRPRPRLSDAVLGQGDHRYRVQTDWCPPAAGRPGVKNCHEMVQVADGRLFMINDSEEHNILIFDKGGKLLDHWTAGLPAGHGLTLHDEGGTEYLYLTCPGTGQVVKCTLDGRTLLRLPDPRTIQAYNDCAAYRPTETAIGPNGDIYVTDGYGSQFILRFDARGNFISKFGGDSTLQDDKFNQAHGVAVDYRGDTPRLVCSARMKNAFKWFTLEGEYLETVYLPGAFVSRPVLKGDHLYTGVCFGMYPGDYRMHEQRGFVTILDGNNRVVSNPGGTEPTYRNGKLELMLQQSSVFRHCHDVCVDDEENLYVCQWRAGGVYPYKLIRV